MISVEEALEKILASVSVLEAEEAPLINTLGQLLARDVYAPHDVPPWDNAAMDGYALRAEDIRGASPTTPKVLPVIGEVAAGSFSKQELKPGTALRIMTGAPLPPGANAVAPFEDTDELKRHPPLSQIGILREVPPGANVRRAGEDIGKASLVLPQGTELRPQEVGVLASLGLSRVPVIRRPVVAILATGDELAEVGEPLPPGCIYNSNTYSLAGQVVRAGGIPQVLGIARDRAQELKEKIHQGLDSDLLITSGGVSKGDYDLVKEVLAEEGEITFWTVRMKPGKPLAFGNFLKNNHRIPHLGLPGNPVSSMITFELFARPAILKMRGKKNLSRPVISAVVEDAITNTDGRRVFARMRVSFREGEYFARVTGPQGSGVLTSLALANGLAIIPETVARVNPGALLPVIMLDWNEEVG